MFAKRKKFFSGILKKCVSSFQGFEQWQFVIQSRISEDFLIYYCPKAKLQWSDWILRSSSIIKDGKVMYHCICELFTYFGCVDQFIGQAFSNWFDVTECGFTCTSAEQPDSLKMKNSNIIVFSVEKYGLNMRENNREKNSVF